MNKTISATKEALSHVLWLGGATDSGKSTTAQRFADRHQLDVYHWDRESGRHFDQLILEHERARAFIEASLNERWLDPTIPELLDFFHYHKVKKEAHAKQVKYLVEEHERKKEEKLK